MPERWLVHDLNALTLDTGQSLIASFMEIYVKKDGQKIGPFSEQAIREQIKSGFLTNSSLAWRVGLVEWCPLCELLPLESSESVSLPESVSFTWWPRSKVGTTIVAVVLVFIFLATITSGFFGSLFYVGSAFLVLTGIRYGLFRYRPPCQKQDSDSPLCEPTPIWRHPVTIGIFVCCLLFLFSAIQSSTDSSKAQQQLAQAIQQNESAYNQFNSTGAQIGRFVAGAAHGIADDYQGAIQIDKDTDAQNNALAMTDSQLRNGYAAASDAKNDADARISAVIWIFIGLGSFLAFRRFKRR